jgi:NADP-dependent 3-hydroxy acid dehydrogenase YdfG
MNKVVVITGVSSGVGRSAAEHFLSNDWIVFGLSRAQPNILNKNFYYIKTDIRKYKSVSKSFSKIKDILPKIDLLINNASIFKQKSFQDFTIEEMDDIIDTNLKGTIYCTFETMKLMCAGRIINIGSVSGTHGIEKQSIYSSSKYGINGFAESLNQELIQKNIKISTICPGGINTPLWNNTNPYSGNTSELLQTTDIVNMIDYISKLPPNVVLKTVTIFPTCEWH